MLTATAQRFSVTNSVELQRVLQLPRRVLDLCAVADLTPVFQTESGVMKLWPIQSAALWEAEREGGLFGPIGVGFGKTLITLLLPDAMQSESTVLLVPPQLRNVLLEKYIPEYSEHFVLPVDRLHIVAYSQLSSAEHADILEQYKPDLIIADEAHNLRRKYAARTKRFLRYFEEHPETRFVALSGTMTSKSLTDYAHLVKLALRERAPVPIYYHEIHDWACALDVEPEERYAPGALRWFLPKERWDESEKLEVVREGFRRRLVETPGVVATEEGAIGTSLVINRVSVAIPFVVERAREKLRKTWSIGDEELEDALALYRVLRQLSQGFYYRWAWPGGTPDREWLEARRGWHAAVRSFLTHSSRDGMDSPLLLARAAASGKWKCPEWEAWDHVRDRRAPPVEAVWLSDYLVNAALEWGKEGGIIWVGQRAVGEVIQSRGIPYYDSGDASFATESLIACSIQSQGTGKNLQRYSRNLIMCSPSSGAVWEQLLGRTHRPGQEADEVIVDWYGHTQELKVSYMKAVDDALYIQSTQGQRQKLLYATRLD